MENSGDKVFRGVPVRPEEAPLFDGFVESHDLAPATLRAVAGDLRKFARWFTTANHEPYSSERVTTRDVSDFREYLRREKNQSVATVNRSLCSTRKYLGWLAARGHLPANPARAVKELHRQPLAPKGLDRSQVRKLMREVELRGDIRSNAIFSMFLYTGCRVGDLVSLALHDLMLGERSGQVTFRFGKGGKQRSAPLPLQARRAVAAYLETRPPVDTPKVFIGERGPLTDRGVRALCDRYSALTGVKIHPHLLRHTFAHQYLRNSGNDLTGLAQVLGHSNLNTTSRYVQRSQEDLATQSENLTY
jgi:integrase/recombinase XerC